METPGLNQIQVVRLENAPEYYTDYLRNHPPSKQAYYYCGLARYNRRRASKNADGTIDLDLDFDRAIGDFTEAIRLDPKYQDAYIGRGLALWFKIEDRKAVNNQDKAIEDMSAAIRLDPGSAVSIPLPRVYVDFEK